MIKIAVCDDERIFLDIIARHLNSLFGKTPFSVSIMTYHSPAELLKDHDECHFDAIFLDIDMPKITGFDVAKDVRTKSSDPLLIFVSAKHELVYDSFKFTPFYFIRKLSISELYDELGHVVDKLLIHFRQHKQICIQDSTVGECVVVLKDISYIQSEKHYLFYFAKNVEYPYKERGTISSRELELQSYCFIKPHQRYLVNLSHILSFDYTRNQINMDDGQILPVSKREKESTYLQYKMFKRR